MIRLRAPTPADAVIYFVHVSALGERASLPQEQARIKLGLLALLTMLPDEIATAMKAAKGGLADLGDACARRAQVFGVPLDELREASDRASRAVVIVAEAIFFDKYPDPPTAPAASVEAGLPEPPSGADVDTIKAYHQAITAKNAYLRTLKAG